MKVGMQLPVRHFLFFSFFLLLLFVCLFFCQYEGKGELGCPLRFRSALLSSRPLKDSGLGFAVHISELVYQQVPSNILKWLISTGSYQQCSINLFYLISTNKYKIKHSLMSKCFENNLFL